MGALCCAPVVKDSEPVRPNALEALSSTSAMPSESSKNDLLGDPKTIVDFARNHFEDPVHSRPENLISDEALNYSSEKIKVYFSVEKDLEHEYNTNTQFAEAPYPFSADFHTLAELNNSEDVVKSIDDNVDTYEVFDLWQNGDCLIVVTKIKTVKILTIQPREIIVVKVYQRKGKNQVESAYKSLSHTGLVRSVKYKTLLDLSNNLAIVYFGYSKVEAQKSFNLTKINALTSVGKMIIKPTVKKSARKHCENGVTEAAKFMMLCDISNLKWFNQDLEEVREILLENIETLKGLKLPGASFTAAQFEDRIRALKNVKINSPVPKKVVEKQQKTVKDEKADVPVKEQKASTPVQEQTSNTSAKDVPIQEERIPSAVKEEKEETPVKEEKGEAPVKEEKEEAPAKEEKEDAPVKEEKTDYPVKEEKSESPVKEEKTDSPVKEEKVATPDNQENTESPAKEEEKKELPSKETPETQVEEPKVVNEPTSTNSAAAKKKKKKGRN